MQTKIIILLAAVAGLGVGPVRAADKEPVAAEAKPFFPALDGGNETFAPKTVGVQPRSTPTGKAYGFATLPADNPLAKTWNDPEFQQRLVGTYAFLAELEPRFNAEEQKYYTETIVPLLGKNQERAIYELEWKAKPAASAQFDFVLGNLYFQGDNYTNAAKYFTQATTKFPSFRRAWKNLGLVQVRAGNFDAAIPALARAISLGDADSKTYAIIAYAYMNANRFVSAESAYRMATISEPDNLEYKLALVKCQVGQANYDSAIAMLDELLQRYPEKDLFWAIQANVFLQKNLPAKAAVNFEMLRRLGKITPENLTTLGDIYMTQESPGLALPVYLEAIEKDGWQKPARALRAAEILAGRSAWPEVRAIVAKIRATAGANLAAADELKLLKLESKMAMATGAGAEAIKVLEEIIVRNPLDGESLLLAGDYYLRNNEPDKAQFRYDSAGKLPGFEADAFVKQAQLLVKSSKYVQAVEVLRKAQKVKSRDNVQRYLEKVEQLALASRS